MRDMKLHLSSRSHRTYALALDGFVVSCPKVRFIEEIRPQHLAHYAKIIERGGCTPRTARGRVAVVRTFLRYWQAETADA